MKDFTRTLIRSCFTFVVAVFIISQPAFAQITVSGQITSLNPTQSLVGFSVMVTGTENKIVYTDETGKYHFTLQQGGSYEIRPLDCVNYPLNGVTTYDLVLIYRHYSGTEPLTSPYNIIAADADGNGVLDTVDVIGLRNLALGITQQMPAENFRYIPKDYVFPNPLDPLSPPYPQSIIVQDLQADIENADFFALKIGDVNMTWVTTAGNCIADLPAQITGKITQDLSNDCLINPGEPGLTGWKVTASDGVNSFYGTSNANGEYQIQLLEGTYDVILSKPNNLWNSCADTVHNIAVTLSPGSTVDFTVQATITCPAMTVDLSTPILRRCFDNRHMVQYCNFGTATAENAQVELDLDPFFSFLNSNVPATLLGGNTYSFDIGDVPANTCGQFVVYFSLDCDAVLGQTHCSEARIYPDTICTAEGAWTGADLKVEGVCAGTDVKFTISNTGGDMAEPSSYIVIEDIVIMMPPLLNPFVLPAGASEIITVPANGTTVRLEVDQPAGHPWSDKASATVEGCGTNAQGTFSTGMVNLFPHYDQIPILDIDCMANSGSFDPNDKQGIPSGVLEEHFIPLQQPIEYLIRFQNTGTDTAFTVIIRDTLDHQLDPASVRPLGSSHPYTFNLSGQGALQFVFNNIMLPDSNVNESASHGYVKYGIIPKKDLPEGTRIENKAAIYFDFNEPVITNTTWHTLGSKYLGSSNVVFQPEISLDVFPNPATDVVDFILKSARPLSGTLELFDVSGKIAAIEKFERNTFTVNAGELQAGYYIYRITSKDGVLAVGKLVVARQ